MASIHNKHHRIDTNFFQNENIVKCKSIKKIIFHDYIRCYYLKNKTIRWTPSTHYNLENINNFI